MKYGLVLAGGGGKGAYQIGVWKALREMNIEFEAVAGTSVGALNGALIAQDSFDKAIELWSNINVEQIMMVNTAFFKEFVKPGMSTLSKSNWNNMVTYIANIIKNKGLDISPLVQLLSGLIDEPKIRQSDIDFGLVTVSLTDHCPLEYFIKDIPEGKLLDYMLASSYLPCFAPMSLDGKRFIDGGFYDNLPVNLMIKKDIKNIIAVDLHAIGRKKTVNVKNLNYIYIEPSGDIGKILDFDAELSKRNIQMGYLDTLRTFGRYQGNFYYFLDYPCDENILSLINKMDEKAIAEVFDLLKLKTPATKRNLLENAIPAIASRFGGTNKDNYADLFVKVIEYLADVHRIERLKPYTFGKLIELVQAVESVQQPSGSFVQTLKSIKDNLVITKPKYKLAKLILNCYCKLIN